MNLIEKLHCILVSDIVNIWHYPAKKEGPRFYFWKCSDRVNLAGYAFETMEQMIEAAYEVIDPLRIPLPEQIKQPIIKDVE